MRIPRTWRVLSLALVGAGALAACSTPAPSPTAAPAKPTEAPKTAASPAAAGPAASPGAAASPVASPSPAAKPAGDAAKPVAKGPLRTIKLGFIPITDFSGMYVAIEKGFFAEAGLELDMQPMQGGATIVPALIGGSLDVGISNILSVLIARDNGFDVQIVADSAYEGPGSPVHGVIAPANTPIETARDLEGKTVGINTFQNIEHLMMIRWIEKAGGDPSKVNFVEIPFPQMPPAVQNGQLAAAAVVEPFITVARNQGMKVVGNEYLEVQPRSIVAPLVATRDWIEKNRDAAEAFSRAVHLGNEYAMAPANEAETRAAIAKWTRMDPALAGQIALSPLGTRPDPELIGWWNAEAKKLGWVKQDHKMEDLLAPFLR